MERLIWGELLFSRLVFLHLGTHRRKLAKKNVQSGKTGDPAQKNKISIQDFFSKCKYIRSFLRICLYLLGKSLMQNFILCALWSKLNILSKPGNDS